MRNPPMLIIDCETLGLGDAPIWEIAAIQLKTNGDVIRRLSMSVKHEDPMNHFDSLPEQFQQDYLKRFDPESAVSQVAAVGAISRMCSDRPTVLGSNVWFDMSRIEKMARDNEVEPPGWHYHPEDMPTLARGWLYGKGVFPAPPWKSDVISQMIGVDPREFDRHTAVGDCEWTLAMWRKVTRS